MIKKFKVLLLSLLMTSTIASAQTVGISADPGNTANSKAILDLDGVFGTDYRGMLLPRMTEAQKVTYGGTLGATEEGMTMYNITNDRYEFWDGTQWMILATTANLSSSSLDDAYDAGGSALGRVITADNGAVEIQGSGGLHVAGSTGIGTTSPLLALDIRGNMIVGNGMTPDALTDNNLINVMSGSNATGTQNGISFYENNSGFGMTFGYDGTGSGDANALRIYNYFNVPLVTFEYGGEVGIGTTTPSTDLHVVGNTRVTGLGGGGNAVVTTDNNGLMGKTSLTGNVNDIYNGAGAFVDATTLTVTGDNLGNHLATTTINTNGNDIDMVRGDLSQIRSVGSISFDWTTGTYDTAPNHGIMSTTETGTLRTT